MHWTIILLLTVVGIILYFIGVGVTIGCFRRLYKFDDEDDEMVYITISTFLWWLVLPIIGIVTITLWAESLVSNETTKK